MKRFLIIICILGILISLLAIPVFAAGNYTFTFGPSSDAGMFMLIYRGTPLSLPGSYLGDFRFVSGDTVISFSDVPLDFVFESSGDDGQEYTVIYGPLRSNAFYEDLGREVPLYLAISYTYVGSSYSIVKCYLVGNDDELGEFAFPGDSMTLTIKRPSVPIQNVNGGLTAAIGWVGSVAQALIDGPLSGLLPVFVVVFAVAAVFLVIRIVRSFGWGL